MRPKTKNSESRPESRRGRNLGRNILLGMARYRRGYSFQTFSFPIQQGVLVMVMATPRTTPYDKKVLIFTLECRNCADLFSTTIGLKPFSG